MGSQPAYGDRARLGRQWGNVSAMWQTGEGGVGMYGWMDGMGLGLVVSLDEGRMRVIMGGGYSGGAICCGCGEWDGLG
jgi:hypothetical protein